MPFQVPLANGFAQVATWLLFLSSCSAHESKLSGTTTSIEHFPKWGNAEKALLPFESWGASPPGRPPADPSWQHEHPGARGPTKMWAWNIWNPKGLGSSVKGSNSQKVPRFHINFWGSVIGFESLLCQAQGGSHTRVGAFARWEPRSSRCGKMSASLSC